MITIAPGEECECNAFGSVCPSIRTRNSKNVAPIELIFLHNKYYIYYAGARSTGGVERDEIPYP